MIKATSSRRQREKVRYKEEILSIALGLFSQKGFYNVSMQEIADKAEFGVGTLYNFFESKESLFEELIQSTGEKVSKEIITVLEEDGNAIQRFRRFIRYHTQLPKHYGDALRLYVSVSVVKPALSYKVLDTFHEKILSCVADLIQTGIKEGVFRLVDANIAAKAVLAAIETMTFNVNDNINEEQAAEAFEQIEQLFLGGLLKHGANDNG